MRSILRAAAGLFLVFLTSACLLETETTLGDPDPKTADTRLLGAWFHVDKDEVIVFSLVADEKEPGTYRAVYASITPGKDESVETTSYRVWRTVLNGRSYLNARRIGRGANNMPAQTIIAYDITDNALTLRFPDLQRLAGAIDGGQLKGTVVKGGYVDKVRLTSARGELAAFIAAADKDGALFPNSAGSLKRIPQSAMAR
jgi:hypothetical protein